MKVLTATTSAFLLLIQALGLQLVCLCGACDLSQAWSSGLGLPVAPHEGEVHDCCKRAMDQAHPGAAGLTGNTDCCGNKHAVQAPESTTPERQAALDLHATSLAVLSPTLATPAVLPTLIALGSVQARGPPGPPAVPLFLTHQALLI